MSSTPPRRTPNGQQHTPLKVILLDMLRRSGRISFERYMAVCLYDPEHGYYMQDRERTGIRGDYFTSPDLHPIFARLVARQAVEMWDLLARPARFSWVEMGAGRGWFAHDFLHWVQKTRPDFRTALEYVAVEPGEKSRARILDRLKSSGLTSGVQVCATLDEVGPVTGCFFSNELVDAFPVAVVTRTRGRLREMYVTAQGEALREATGPISNSNVAAAVARYANQLGEGHRVEVNLAAVRWIRYVAEKLARGFVLTLDYGDLAERLYTPERPRGTLLAYRNHIASENLFDAPGEQDLTSHVNFSALIDAGREAELLATGFTAQERFLMALGESSQFADLYDPGQNEAEQLDARLKLKRLLYPGDAGEPTGMGNMFKVLVQHRGVDAPRLTGFKWSDKYE